MKGHNWKVVAVAFSYDSKYAITGSTDGTIKLWEVETGNLLHTYEPGYTTVLAIAMSPDITRIASAGKLSNPQPDTRFALYVWDSHVELESAKNARLKKFREDSVRHLKDSVKRYQDSVKLARDSVKKAQEQQKKNKTPDNKPTPAPGNKNPGNNKTMAPVRKEN